MTCTLFTATPKEMTLDEKVGQLLMVHFQGENANEAAADLINNAHVGAIIYYRWSNGLHNPGQVQALSSGLQQMASKTRLGIPLLIAADQEGGRVARFKEGFTQFPANMVLAATGDPNLVKQCALTTAQELMAVGVNMNLAPVVDVNNNPLNPLIGVRSYGSDPQTVVTHASKALEGYRQGGMLTSLKHFPGHGDVITDSHFDLPIVDKSRAQLDAMELLPFAALAPFADTIMTAHIMIPQLDPDHCATTSKTILNILRNDFGFQNPIITDSLVMEGILKLCQTPEEAAIASHLAGCDILLLGGKQLKDGDTKLELNVEDIKRIHQVLVKAVKDGRISEESINRSVERVLTLKRKIGVIHE